jgi:hypothetical protein
LSVSSKSLLAKSECTSIISDILPPSRGSIIHVTIVSGMSGHAHREEFAPNRADPMMPELSPEQAQAEMTKMLPTWGKVIITWIPNDDLPSFPPQVQLVDHPFMVNATVSSGGNNTANATSNGGNSTGL